MSKEIISEGNHFEVEQRSRQTRGSSTRFNALKVDGADGTVKMANDLVQVSPAGVLSFPVGSLAADIVTELNLANTLSGVPVTLTGAGAVSIAARWTLLVTTGANALTIAAGTRAGQAVTIFHKTDGGDGTLTGAGFTSIVFSAVQQWATLVWNGTGWDAVQIVGCAYTA